MTYLFSANTNVTNEVEIKNDANSALRVNVANGGANVTTTNPFPVTITNGISSVNVLNNNSIVTTTNPFPVTGNVNITGTINTSLYGATSTTAFGEAYGITITPVIQLDGIYGITSEVIQTYTNGTGSYANANNGLFQVSSGTSVGGYGVLRSKRFLRYRPGQGALCRFTASFTPNTALTSQRAGLFNQESALMVGWNPDANSSPVANTPKFGVMRATGGKAEIRQLTINSISTGSQNLTVTLNGTAFTVTGVNTSNTTLAAMAIATHVGGYTGWLVDQVDNTVVFLSDTLGSKSGTYSLTGTGTVSGTFNQRQAGVAQTENWTYQDAFNIDKLDGTGPSGMVLKSEYLNVYQINLRWLGAGEIRYAIEDETTGNMVFFHHEHYVNRNTTAHISQPSFKIGYVAYSTGSTTNVDVKGASIMGAIEGTIFQNELNRSGGASKTTLASGSVHHLMTIRNPYVTNGKAGALNGNYILNAKEVILKDISVGVQGNDPGTIYLFYEATSFTGSHAYKSQPKDNAMISDATGTLNPTVDTAICRFVTAINGEAQYKLSDFRIAVPPGSSISIGIDSTSQISRVTVALVFSED